MLENCYKYIKSTTSNLQYPGDLAIETGFSAFNFSILDLNSLWNDTSDLWRHAKATLNCLISSSRSFLLRISLFKSRKTFSFCSVTTVSLCDELETLLSRESFSSSKRQNSFSKIWYLSLESSRSWLFVSNFFSKLWYFSFIELTSLHIFSFQEAISPPKVQPLAHSKTKS